MSPDISGRTNGGLFPEISDGVYRLYFPEISDREKRENRYFGDMMGVGPPIFRETS